MADQEPKSPTTGERTRSDQPGGTSVDPTLAGYGKRPQGVPDLGTPERMPGPAGRARVPGGDLSDLENLEDAQEPRHETD